VLYRAERRSSEDSGHLGRDGKKKTREDERRGIRIFMDIE
jgi:hypothetical protein